MTTPASFENKEVICLDSRFSTTRRVMREKPVIVNAPLSKVESLLFFPPHPQRKGEGGLRTKGYFKRSSTTTDKSSEKLPLVSIITVVFNGEEYLEQTIRSVLDQTHENVEYIIIDGGSTDRTVEIIRQYEDRIDYWVSEPDSGIYDAMNKGIQASTGELIGILNSSDFYTPNALENVLKAYRENSHPYSIISGAMIRLDEEKNLVIKNIRDEQTLAQEIYWTTPVNHPATFVTKAAYEIIGTFNKNYKIVGDYDLFFRAYHEPKIQFIFTSEETTYHRLGGVSGKFTSLPLCLRETYVTRKGKVSTGKNLSLSFYFLTRQLIKHGLKSLLGDRVLMWVNRGR